VVSLPSSVDATLDVFDSGATSPAMRRLWKASRGAQLFELMLPRCTNYHGFVLLPFLAALFYNFQHGAFFFASFLKNSIEVLYFSNIILH